jgi:probable F420-dependent oxidoreductase
MPLPLRIALSLPDCANTVQDTLALGRRAEALGYDDLWLAETGQLDALTLAALLLQATSRVRVGIAVVPAYTRTPVVFASTVATLAQIAGGRFALGLGTSSHAMIEGWHGLELKKPLTRMRETVLLLRQILAGEKTRFDGETLRSHGYRMEAVPGGVPIALAALRPKMIELAAEIGDGVVINLFPRGALGRIRNHIAIGAARAGKDPDDVELICRHQVAVTDDPSAARESFRKLLTAYYATPVYNTFLAWCGHEDAAREIREGWASGDRARTTAAMSDALIDEIAIIGNADQCHQRVREYAAAGIHTHIIAIVGKQTRFLDATVEAFSSSSFQF